MDETWLHHYDAEIKQQSMEWRHSGSPYPKNSECKNPLEKFSPRFFWDQNGIVLIDYVPKGQTINAEYYSSLLVQLKDILQEKRRGKFSRGACSCTTMPRLTGHLQPRRNWPTFYYITTLSDKALFKLVIVTRALLDE